VREENVGGLHIAVDNLVVLVEICQPRENLLLTPAQIVYSMRDLCHDINGDRADGLADPIKTPEGQSRRAEITRNPYTPCTGRSPYQT
jgi:hypothetical protein